MPKEGLPIFVKFTTVCAWETVQLVSVCFALFTCACHDGDNVCVIDSPYPNKCVGIGQDVLIKLVVDT